MPECVFKVDVSIGATGQVVVKVPKVKHPFSVSLTINSGTPDLGKNY